MRRVGKKPPDNAAFSVVEIIIVAGIIAILMISLFPMYRQITSVGQKAKCLSSLTQIYNGVHLYSSDNQGMIPCAALDTNGNYKTWTMVIDPYVHIKASATDPGLTCPAAPIATSGSGFSKYGINGLLSYNSNNHTRVPRFIDVQSVTTTAFLFDSGGETMEQRTAKAPAPARWYIPGYSKNTNVAMFYAAVPDVTRDAHQGRHGRTVNIIMVDGHAETQAVDTFVEDNAFWNVKWHSDPTK